MVASKVGCQSEGILWFCVQCQTCQTYNVQPTSITDGQEQKWWSILLTWPRESRVKAFLHRLMINSKWQRAKLRRIHPETSSWKCWNALGKNPGGPVRIESLLGQKQLFNLPDTGTSGITCHRLALATLGLDFDSSDIIVLIYFYFFHISGICVFFVCYNHFILKQNVGESRRKDSNNHLRIYWIGGSSSPCTRAIRSIPSVRLTIEVRGLPSGRTNAHTNTGTK